MHYDQSPEFGNYHLDNLNFMGCLFGCFGVKYGRRQQSHIASDVTSAKIRESVTSKNQLSTLLLQEERSSSAQHLEDGTMHVQGTPERDQQDWDLKDEAKFLKTCGAILQTPSEIRKLSQKQVGEEGSSRFHSWLPGTSCTQTNWEDQPNKLSISEQPAKLQNEENSPSSRSRSVSFEGKKVYDNGSSDTRAPGCLEVAEISHHGRNSDASPSTTIECSIVVSPSKVKSVRFKCSISDEPIKDFVSLDSISPESGVNDEIRERTDDIPGNVDVVGQPRVLNFSPNPTPLRLTDDMQTPGTVYLRKPENFTVGKDTEIRTQYVFPVNNDVENISQWTALKKVSVTDEIDRPMEVCCQQETASRAHLPQSGLKQTQPIPLSVDTDLSCMNEALSPEESGELDCASPFHKKYCQGKSFDDDRPIIGAVAAHWNDENTLSASPKEWDGNGIPNSTTKYKEDQKVQFHATPFEERLEKALSDERHLPRKHNDEKPIHLGESISNCCVVDARPS